MILQLVLSNLWSHSRRQKITKRFATNDFTKCRTTLTTPCWVENVWRCLMGNGGWFVRRVFDQWRSTKSSNSWPATSTATSPTNSTGCCSCASSATAGWPLCDNCACVMSKNVESLQFVQLMTSFRSLKSTSGRFQLTSEKRAWRSRGAHSWKKTNITHSIKTSSSQNKTWCEAKKATAFYEVFELEYFVGYSTEINNIIIT